MKEQHNKSTIKSPGNKGDETGEAAIQLFPFFSEIKYHSFEKIHLISCCIKWENSAPIAYRPCWYHPHFSDHHMTNRAYSDYDNRLSAQQSSKHVILYSRQEEITEEKHKLAHTINRSLDRSRLDRRRRAFYKCRPLFN
jgi:hypothetical protein